jgi:hypothetical protein
MTCLTVQVLSLSKDMDVNISATGLCNTAYAAGHYDHAVTLSIFSIIVV